MIQPPFQNCTIRNEYKYLISLFFHFFTCSLQRKPEGKERGDDGGHRVYRINERQIDSEQSKTETQEEENEQSRMLFQRLFHRLGTFN